MTDSSHGLAPSPLVGRIASLVLWLSGAVGLAALAFALARLGSPVSGLQVVVFVVLPVVWVLANVAALRSGLETRVGFALLQLALVGAVLMSEVAATLWLHSRAVAGEPPSMREEALRFRAAGTQAYPRIAGNEIVNYAPQLQLAGATFRPLAPAPAHATVLMCNEDRPMLTYESDRFGFDNPDSVWNAAQADIALVGDSYTVGVCVPSDQAIPGRLREHGTVLNLGMSGAGPLHELALLREFAAPLKPKQVVWLFYEGNDFWDLNREADRDWLTAYLNAATVQGLRDHQQALDAGYRAWIDSLVALPVARAEAPRDARALSLRGVASLTTLQSLLPIDLQAPGYRSELGLLPEILSRADSDVAAWGGSLLVVYMPSYRRFRTILGDPYPDRTALLDTLRVLGIPTLDLHDTFEATEDPRALWITPRSHLTPDGYGLASETIARALGLGRATPAATTTATSR